MHLFQAKRDKTILEYKNVIAENWLLWEWFGYYRQNCGKFAFNGGSIV